MISSLFRRSKAPARVKKAPRRLSQRSRQSRQARFEQMEERRMLAADVLLGSVYYEEATGDDTEGDIIQVSFVGGAVGTTLDQIVIDGDKKGDGISAGDVFFDTTDGGFGAFSAVGYELVSSDGFTITGVEVIDGGSQIVLAFSGFDAGEKLVFSVDVDEFSFVDGDEIDVTAVAEGGEFQRSTIVGEFSASGYVDLTLGATYWDTFDENFDLAEAAAGSVLTTLPDDAYESSNNLIDRTAGAVAHAPQLKLASLSGHVYHDQNDDGTFDSDESPIAGVTVELLNASGNGTGITTVTNGAGYYEFKNLEAGTWGVRETQPNDYFDGKDTIGSHGGAVTNDLFTGIVLAYGDDGIDYNFGELLAGSIAGRVHASRDGDCDFNDPDILLEGVVVELLSPAGAVLATTKTDSQGRYKFDGLRPGEYQVREQQPADYYDGDERAGTAGGTVTNDLVGGILLGSNEDATQYDFCEHVGANLSGYVYHDRSDDGSRDSGEEPISEVSLKLLLEDGTDTGQRAVTNSGGFYQFTNLDRGTYRVMEIHPTDWIDGKDTAGTEGGTADSPGDMIREITLDFGDDARDYNFGELLPGSIAGRVHASRDGDCDFDDPDILLAGVVIELRNADGELISTTETDSNGEYRFDDLPPAEYQIHERQPDGYYDGDERSGTAGGTVSDDLIVGIHLGSDQDAVRYDFCEHIGANLSGYVYHDQSDDGLFDANEDPIAGVTLELLNAEGVGTGITTITNSDGFYEFTNLEAGTWGVRETQPSDFFDGKDTVGSHLGTAGNDIITGAVLDFGDRAVNYNFGELLGASLAGRVHASRDGDCDFDDPDILLEGVVIELLSPTGEVIKTTTTDSLGRYKFTGLRPGEYQVREQQPADYYDGDEHAGSAGGTVTDDLVSGILLGSAENATQYDFCEHIGANLSGYVYHDRSNEGNRDADEESIAGVTIKLLNGDGTDTGKRAVTNAEGRYVFTNLNEGTYCVMEVHPVDWIDGLDKEGNLGGSPDNPGDMICEITLGFGDNATEYNFGELLPGSIAGSVHSSRDGNCLDEETASPIEGVVIQLLNASGEVIATTETDVNGDYRFDDLPPGVYGVREVQPVDFFDESLHIGSGGGISFVANEMADVTIGSDAHLVNYDFCEAPPAALAGYVFIDGSPIFTFDPLPEDISSIRDGRRTDDDTPLEGVTLRLVNGKTGAELYIEGTLSDEEAQDKSPIEVLPGFYTDGKLETVTDANGYYQFLGLPSGSYAVVEVGPDGLIDGIDTPGTLGGQAANPGEEGRRVELFQESYGNDAILSIELLAGDFSVENNFSEVTVTTYWQPPETPEVPPTPLVFSPNPITPRPLLTPLTPPATPEIPTINGSALGYTWHLSVINGGQPRTNTEISEAETRFVSMKTATGEWQGADRSAEELSRAKWQLLASDIEGADLSEFLFGSEDAIPVSGDWNGDGITDIGVFVAGNWYLDLNGDGRWDRSDLWAKLGTIDDLPVTGDWDGDGKTDIGIFGPAWARDPHAIRHEPGMPDVANYPGPIAAKMKNMPPVEDEATSGGRLLKQPESTARRTDLIDHVFHYGVAGDAPVAGDWNGDGIRTIGVFNDGLWALDTDGDGRLTDTDRQVALGQAGDKPIVGDWDGDGIDELGVYRAGEWLVDADGDGILDATDQAFAETANEEGALPITGDWDGDGIDEPGVYTPTGTVDAPEVRVSRRAG